MKSKLKLTDLRVQSFITTVDGSQMGGSVPGQSDLCGTNASCYRHVSCAEVMCIVRSSAEPCVMDDLRTAVRNC